MDLRLLKFGAMLLVARFIFFSTSITKIVSFLVVPQLPNSFHVISRLLGGGVLLGQSCIGCLIMLNVLALAAFQSSLLDFCNDSSPVYCHWHLKLHNSSNFFLESCYIFASKK